MPKIVKKRKTGFAPRSFAGGGQGEQSPLRPRHVEKKPPCRNACPSGNRIREFLITIAQADARRRSISAEIAGTTVARSPITA